ncbi:MAG: beta-N-acetylhexosaminidase [Clostridia bacterium]
MKSKKGIIAILIILIIVFVILIGVKMYRNRKDKTNNNLNSNVENINTPKEPTIEEKVDEEIKGMTLREKIGQMLVISYSGTEYTDKLDELLNSVKPGGFILFKDNISNYSSTVDYISRLKDTATIPMLMSVDQEGGRVQRIKDVSDVNVQNIPDMYTLGKTNDVSLSYDVGKVIAEELNAFGVNTDYAPVLDIFSNPNNTVIGTRAFGSDAQTVINMAIPFANGMKENGVIPTYKHFPGHGDTDTDSHIELPVVTKTKEELYKNELLPFKAAIENGAQMIMVAHIALPNVTGDYTPASLSNKIVNGILRDELGYNGVVITDGINMKALADNYSVKQICSYSINAGVDIILMPPDPLETVNIIEGLVNEGVITEQRIDESVKRILLMKHNNGLYDKKDLNKDNIGTQEHIDIINKIKV